MYVCEKKRGRKKKKRCWGGAMVVAGKSIVDMLMLLTISRAIKMS